jgi:hypothetical protein
MYTHRTNSTNYQNKTFVCTKQIIWTVGTNMYTCRTNYQNKTFVRIKHFIWTVGTNMYMCPNKAFIRTEHFIWTGGTNTYMCRINSTNYQNKTFIRTEQIIWIVGQICTRVEQILQTTRTKYLYVLNKLYEMCWTNFTN